MNDEQVTAYSDNGVLFKRKSYQAMKRHEKLELIAMQIEK